MKLKLKTKIPLNTLISLVVTGNKVSQMAPDAGNVSSIHYRQLLIAT